MSKDQVLPKVNRLAQQKLGRRVLKAGDWTAVRLVEVWKLGEDQILIHPSRNRFYWAGDVETKRLLHTLATRTELMMAGRQYANRMQPATSQKPIGDEMRNKPHPV